MVREVPTEGEATHGKRARPWLELLKVPVGGRAGDRGTLPESRRDDLRGQSISEGLRVPINKNDSQTGTTRGGGYPPVSRGRGGEAFGTPPEWNWSVRGKGVTLRGLQKGRTGEVGEHR
jgi:hypothetical protein